MNREYEQKRRKMIGILLCLSPFYSRSGIDKSFDHVKGQKYHFTSPAVPKALQDGTGFPIIFIDS